MQPTIVFDRKRIALVLVIVAANVLLDQATKAWARQYLLDAGRQSYLWDFFRLSYVENRGAFLSLGAGLSGQLRYWALKILPVLLLLGLLAYTLFGKGMNRWQLVAFSCILGGGVSNIYDRLLYNQVVDFMNMGFPGLRTGIFNFADVSIMLGLAIILPTLWASPPSEEETEEDGKTTSP